VFNLIVTAESEGWLEQLIRRAINSNPGNKELKIISPPNASGGESNQLLKILILAAIPDKLRLDREIREIREAIERARNRDIFEIKIRTAVRPKDIRIAIAEEQPQIVHFCGHGEEDGSLRLEDDGGNDKPVAPSALASLFKLHADYVQCVVLNACYSEKSAEAISEYINYVIGMNNSIIDNAAIVFSEGFYHGLGYISNNQDMFQRAFEEGMVAIQMESPSQGS
ncbi:MAG: CHAT domain-containing protein, partial [Cyanobacteria bacterium J06635_10]